jgi:tRNA (guanine-N7-)-methyltransferase
MSDDKHPIRFYGRRKGKILRTARQDAYDGFLPSITIPDNIAEPSALFDFKPEKIWMEVGFGDGEHLIYQAMQNPDIGLIGCEPFINGIANLCVDIQENNVRNIRIWPDDARLLLPKLPDACLDRFFLLNSDPWPKTRHHKRRFVQKETLDDIHRLLKPGAQFRMSSDHAALVSWQLEKTYFHGGFDWSARSQADWAERPQDLPETRYQGKGLKQGRPTSFLDFTRKI